MHSWVCRFCLLLSIWSELWSPSCIWSIIGENHYREIANLKTKIFHNHAPRSIPTTSPACVALIHNSTTANATFWWSLHPLLYAPHHYRQKRQLFYNDTFPTVKRLLAKSNHFLLVFIAAVKTGQVLNKYFSPGERMASACLDPPRTKMMFWKWANGLLRFL